MVQTKRAKVYMSCYVAEASKDAVIAEADARGVAQSEVVEDLITAARRGVVAEWTSRDLIEPAGQVAA